MTEHHTHSMKLETRKAINGLLILLFLFVLGIAIGLVVLGWWLWPVKWTNVPPNVLDRPYQITYITMVADSYSTNHNVTLMRERLAFWDSSELNDLISDAKTNSAKIGDLQSTQNIDSLVQALGMPITVAPTTDQLVTIPSNTPERISWAEVGKLTLITFILSVVFVSLTAAALRIIVLGSTNNYRTLDQG